MVLPWCTFWWDLRYTRCTKVVRHEIGYIQAQDGFLVRGEEPIRSLLGYHIKGFELHSTSRPLIYCRRKFQTEFLRSGLVFYASVALPPCACCTTENCCTFRNMVMIRFFVFLFFCFFRYFFQTALFLFMMINTETPAAHSSRSTAAGGTHDRELGVYHTTLTR